MGWLSRVLSGSLRADTPNAFDDHWYQPVGTLTESGMRVDANAAQKISAWYRGRDILATVLAMLPLQIFERLPNNGGANPAYGHPLYDVLHDKPNPRQDSFQWRRQAMYHLIDHGNSYDWELPGLRGPIDQLEPIIDPTTVRPKLITSGRYRGRRLYDIRDPKTGITTEYNDGEIFHLMGASSDGIVGQGILEFARTSVGTALATESYAARIFSKGTLNAGVIENPGVLDQEASRRMAKSFVTAAGEWHLPKVLEQGSKWVESKLTPEDAQMLLSRKFSIDDMARWLGVPRQMLENNDPSFGNAEQFDRNFIAYSMGPWLSLFEFAINDQLIVANRRYFAQFTRQAIVRGDLTARWNAHVQAVNAGIMTVDEVRGVEDLNKRGGKADELREPQNITGKPVALDVAEEKPVKREKPNALAVTTELADDLEVGQQARAIAVETAARLLRKEVAAVQKLAVRHAGDEDAFVVAVTTFYAKHVALVEASLHWSHDHADAYCAEQAHQIVNLGWLAALETWKTADYAEGLAGLALERIEAA
jgi:HK97 family phage portal protein